MEGLGIAHDPRAPPEKMAQGLRGCLEEIKKRIEVSGKVPGRIRGGRAITISSAESFYLSLARFLRRKTYTEIALNCIGLNIASI